MLHGRLVSLMPYTPERCHEFWRQYVPDPDMWDIAFIYNPGWVDRYYQNRAAEPDRRMFAICHLGETVGEIQLKHIDFGKGCATMSIHLANDGHKNRGWGSEAERLITDYAFSTLGLHTVYADCAHRNTRSRRVLEKTGFVFTHADGKLRYYVLKRPD